MTRNQLPGMLGGNSNLTWLSMNSLCLPLQIEMQLESASISETFLKYGLCWLHPLSYHQTSSIDGVGGTETVHGECSMEGLGTGTNYREGAGLQNGMGGVCEVLPLWKGGGGRNSF